MSAPRVYLGFDAAEMVAWNVARYSLMATSSIEVDVQRITMGPLQSQGLYTRPTDIPTAETPRYFDHLSQAPMSTAHAIARFFIPHLCAFGGYALFTDGDVLFRDDVAKLFAFMDPRYAVSVVKHGELAENGVKKGGGHAQQAYPRKNWSSVMLFNCAHPSNRKLTLEYMNTVPGREMHAFSWLADDEIGTLPDRWNVLVGHEDPTDAAILHYTDGTPNLPGYEDQPLGDEWRRMARVCGYRITDPVREVA